MVTIIEKDLAADREKSKPIFLIGFMGCGKSTVGKLLAEKKETTFVDLDAELELLFGKSIGELFREGRETEFRQAESASVIKHAKSREAGIIATGGGACGDLAAREAMRGYGLVFWLDAAWPVLRARILGDSRRPMLARDPETLYNQRKAVYEACAHFRVDASAPPEIIASEIFGLTRPACPSRLS